MVRQICYLTELSANRDLKLTPVYYQLLCAINHTEIMSGVYTMKVESGPACQVKTVRDQRHCQTKH